MRSDMGSGGKQERAALGKGDGAPGEGNGDGAPAFAAPGETPLPQHPQA